MRLGHLLGQILPIVQNASAASTVTGGFCLFSQVSLPGSEKSDPGIPESSREFPLPGIPIVAPCSTIVARPLEVAAAIAAVPPGALVSPSKPIGVGTVAVHRRLMRLAGTRGLLQVCKCKEG